MVYGCGKTEFYKAGEDDKVMVSDLASDNLNSGANADEALKVARGCICHVPPGNPARAHTICIGEPAIPSHIDHHEDFIGSCDKPVLQVPPPRGPITIPAPPPIEEPAPETI